MPISRVLMPLTLIGATILAPLSGIAQRADLSLVPGTVIAHYPKSGEKYVGSPGIASVGNGVYLAKHDEFGPASSEWSSAITQLYRSEDAGKSWKRTHTFDGMYWASIFTLGDSVYLMGTDKHHGNAVIVRSSDGGWTWTKPTDADNGLLLTGEYHTSTVPIVVHNGRVWRAMEDAGGGDVLGAALPRDDDERAGRCRSLEGSELDVQQLY